MGLRETKVKQRPRLKLTRKTKTTRKIKIKKRIKFKLNPLKRYPARLLPISVKKGKTNIKPLSHSLSKVLEIPVPNNIYEIKTMCAILGMHLAISPTQKVAIEKKYQQVLEKLIEIYSELEMKPFRVKILNHFKEELKKSKKSFSLSKSLIKNKSKKFLELVKRYSAKSKLRGKLHTRSKSKSKNKSIHGGRVVHLEGDWTDYPPLPSMTYKNCVASSYRLLNLLNGEEADELGRESAQGLMSQATIKWLNEIYGEDHYLIRFWTKGQVVDNVYMEELDAFFTNLLPSNDTGTMIHVKNHFFNVVRNEFGQIVFYDLQAKWIYENENNERQYYWTIRFQDFYEFLLERVNNTPFIEVVSQNYMLPNFEPTNQEFVESTHFRYGRRYALNEIRTARREKGNTLEYYYPNEYENDNGNNENNNENNYREWGAWHDSYYTWNEYTLGELKAIINGRTRIKFSESQKEAAGRYFYYRYGWDGIVPEGNNEEENNGEVYDAPQYPIAPGMDEYAEWETPLLFAIELEHDRYNFDLYDSRCDIGKYGEVDLPTHNDIRYDYDTLWMTWSYMKYIRFWINEYMFGNHKLTTYTVEQLERMLLHYNHKNHKLIEEIPYYSTMIEDYSSPIYRDKIGIGRSNLLYATQKQIQKTINLLSTFISNIKAIINTKSGRRVYKFDQKEMNRTKKEQLFRKEATITEFRKITGDDRGCRFTKYGKGYTVLGGNGAIEKNIIGGSAVAMEDDVEVYTGDRGAGGTGFERGAANRPKPIKRKPNQNPKQTDISITINCALDPTCPNQKACEEYIRSQLFETRILCEPRENMEHIIRKIHQTWDDMPSIALQIIRVILPLIQLYKFTDLPALTILEYIYANTEEDKEALVGDKFMDSLFYDKAIEYIFTEEFFDKAMSERIDWSAYDSFTDPKMSEEEIEEIQEHINNMAARYNPDYVIIEESYDEYSGGYLNSLIPIYISESIIQKPLMSDEVRAAVTAYMATDEHYTPEYIENIRTQSWPIDEAGFRRRTNESIYEHYAYEDEELY